LIRTFRLERGWTQADLALALGVSTGYIGLIEGGKRGRNLSRDLALRIIHALDLNIGDSEALLRATGHLGEAEHLLPPGGRSAVIHAIEVDDYLPERSKRLLVSLYDALSRRAPSRGQF
jgi:transcriptional regulator with XRE-family HTH domain